MDSENVRNRLLQREQQLMVRVSKIESDLGSVRPRHPEERAIAAENDEVLEQLDQVEREELSSIRTALARIDAGQYATCASCEGEIAAGRLEALPFTTLCVECAS